MFYNAVKERVQATCCLPTNHSCELLDLKHHQEERFDVEK